MSGSIGARPTFDADVDSKYTETYSRMMARRSFWATRDKTTYTCPDCGRGQDRVTRFEVHHRDGDPYNNDPENLVGLCQRCHVWRHKSGPTLSGLDLDEWKAEFLAIGDTEGQT